MVYITGNQGGSFMKQEKNKKPRKGLKTLLIVFFLFLALLAAALIYGYSKLSKISYDDADIVFAESETETGTGTEKVLTKEEVAEEIAEEAVRQNIALPEKKKETKSDVVNILFLGTDMRIKGTSDPGRADSTMLCSLNMKTGDVKLISFERGIYVPVPGQGQDLLTHAYHWGGANLSQSIIEECFQLDVAGYAQVDFDSFKLVIDTIGGVDIELTNAEAGVLGLRSGLQHLDGEQALAYCRLRSIDSDWQRQERQRNTITAALKQVRSLSLSELDSTMNTLLPLIHTNLSKTQISSLFLNATKFIQGDVSQLQVPDKNSTNGYIKCDFPYEHKKICNFIYDTNFDITSPY